MTIERKYAMTRIKAGDYLLLANDGETVWRIATYTEDGSAIESGTGKEITGRFWGTWKFVGRDKAHIDLTDFSDFEMHDCLLRSRQKAIDAALAEGAATGGVITAVYLARG